MANVQNDRMPLPRRLIGLGLAATLVLSGCSNDEPGDRQPVSGDTSSSPTSTEATPYLEVPEGVELTPQGSELELGDTATVAYEPRQRTVGALDIKVTAVERASFELFEGWELTKETRKTTPYFVRATVENVGETDLGGRPVPLYIVDGENRLIEASVFTGSFRPCDGSMFPERFRTGDIQKACLVYLAPDEGRLTAVSFRPTQEFDPITWTGEVERAGGDEGERRDRGGRGAGEGRDGGSGRDRG